MFKFCKNNFVIKLLATASLLAMFAPVYANKQNNQISKVVSAVAHRESQPSQNKANKSSPNSSVVLDFSITTGESWDKKDSSNNMVANCINGDFITGFEYKDVTLKTVGGSFFSEAVVYFSDSNNGSDGQRVIVGFGDESSGTKTFNSNGIFDLTDIGLEDIKSMSDSVFLLQLYERIDDIQNGIDARYTDGTITVWGINLEPTNNCPFLIQDVNTDSDLAVEYTTNQTSSYQLNDAIEFSISIENNGEASATNITLDNYLSASISIDQMSCDDGTSTSDINELMTLSVQDIGAGDNLVCTLEATIVHYGYIQNSISVNADNDTNPDNDEASLIVNGAIRVIPSNNIYALFVLSLALLFFARKRFIKN